MAKKKPVQLTGRRVRVVVTLYAEDEPDMRPLLTYDKILPVEASSVETRVDGSHGLHIAAGRGNAGPPLRVGFNSPGFVQASSFELHLAGFCQDDVHALLGHRERITSNLREE